MNNKVKVAIVLHGLGANGIDTLFSNLSECWDEDKFEITYMLAVDEGAKQFWENKVVSNGVRVVHLHDLDRKRLFKWPVTLYKALKKYGPFDAVHMNMDMLNGINLWMAKRAGIKTRVCHAHTSSNKNSENTIKKCYVDIMRKMIQGYATKCIACSDVCGEYFFKDLKYEILYNGIDIEKYKRNRKSHDVNAPVFATVGRLIEVKNPFFLIDVFKKITNEKPEAMLKWVGNGELFDAVKSKAEEVGVLENIEFLGVRSDVNEILKQCDYFLLPSKYEGLSLALAEAQAAGLDCFVSDTVSRMSDCGKCKYISLEKEWAEEICSYIDFGERMELIPERMEMFDIRHMARKLEEMYTS